MALPLQYSLRNIVVRRASSIFTAIGIALTVAVFAGVLSLHSGFAQLYQDRGREDRAIYLRPGATSEGESAIQREQVEILKKERPETAIDPVTGRPLAAAEMYLAVYMDKADGGVTNVALRGIEPMSRQLRGDEITVVEGRWLEYGSDEIVVGAPLTRRMKNCGLGDTLTINMTPFRVVGVFASESAEGGEVWGDVDRFMAALDRPVFQRVIAQVKPGTDFVALAEELEHDARVPAVVMSERQYLAAQTMFTGQMLEFLATFLTTVMAVAAVLGATNTMMASVSARTHEIGVLLAIGYKRLAIFLAFLFEAAVIGLIGGAAGILVALPFHGIETGLSNWNTFTDVSFAVNLTPELMAQSFGLAFVLGLVGGALPALRAARMKPVDAFRER